MQLIAADGPVQCFAAISPFSCTACGLRCFAAHQSTQHNVQSMGSSALGQTKHVMFYPINSFRQHRIYMDDDLKQQLNGQGSLIAHKMHLKKEVLVEANCANLA